MPYKIKVDLISRREIENLEDFLDKTIYKGFKKDGDLYGGHDPISDKWEGVYQFSFIRNGYAVKADFSRISRDGYRGSLFIKLEPALESLVLQNLPNLAPSLAKDLRASASA